MRNEDENQKKKTGPRAGLPRGIAPRRPERSPAGAYSERTASLAYGSTVKMSVDRHKLENLLIEQGKTLVRIEANQEHQADDIRKLGESLSLVAKAQNECPARLQMAAKEATARIRLAEKPSRPSIGPLPLPKTTELIKLLPWAIAAGLGIASAMGWIPAIGGP